MSFNDIMVLTKEIALVLFFSMFVGVIYWAYRPAHRKRYEDAGRMILDDDDLKNGPGESKSPPSSSTP